MHHDNKPSLAVARWLGLLEVGEGRYHGAPHRVFVTLPATMLTESPLAG